MPGGGDPGQISGGLLDMLAGTPSIESQLQLGANAQAYIAAQQTPGMGGGDRGGAPAPLPGPPPPIPYTPPDFAAQATALGPEWKSDPDIMSGAPYRPALTPDIGNPASWFDQNYSVGGLPVHVGSPPPPWTSGHIAGGEWDVFHPNNQASLNGGFFTMDDYLDQPGGLNAGNTPRGQRGLSTNNWRLLPPEFQSPDFYMHNGQIVSRRLTQSTLAPKSVLGLEGGGPGGYFPVHDPFDPGQWANYLGHSNTLTGYAGQLGPWAGPTGGVT